MLFTLIGSKSRSSVDFSDSDVNLRDEEQAHERLKPIRYSMVFCL
jgi:hypothetical protein